MGHYRKTPFLIGLVLLLGCETELNIKPIEDYQRILNVFCVLRPEQTRQWVMVERTFGMEESIGHIFSGRVSGAEVRIKGTGQDILLDSYPQNPGYYFTDSLTVEAGKIYTLDILDNSDGTVVTGQTLVPGPIHITSPERGNFPVNETIKTVWNESTNASQYILNLRYRRGIEWSSSKYFTSATNEYDLFGFLFAFPGDYLIEVLAVDENYYFYSLGNNGSESTQEITKLDGGLGVFGSAAADSVWVIVESHSIYYGSEF
ncbi:DUF4249 family protein [candidate division KSB1 bacterium]